METDIEPDIREQFQALMETTPGMALILFLSFAAAIGRFVYVSAILRSDSALEAIRLRCKAAKRLAELYSSRH